MRLIVALWIATYCCGVAHAAPSCLSQNIRYLFSRQSGQCEDAGGRPGLNRPPPSVRDKEGAAQFLREQSRCLNESGDVSTGLCMDLSGIDLTGQSLAGTDLSGSRMVRANFTKADLRHARLYLVDASRAVFAQADLGSAQLAGARFAGADLQEALITWAHATGGDFRGANLRGATLRYSSVAQSLFDSSTVLPEDWGTTPDERRRHAVEVQQMIFENR